LLLIIIKNMKQISILPVLLVFSNITAQVCYNPAYNVNVGTTPKAITASDFNEDGVSDLAVANFGSNSISLLKGLPGGNFNYDTSFSTGSAPHHLIVADFNNDGHKDIVTANNSSSNISVFAGNGHGRFGAPTNYMVGSAPTALVTADLNGDGFLDIGVAVSGIDSIVILKGQGNGAFSKFKALYAASCFGLCTADFNGDAWPDLACCNCSAGSMSVLLATGNGNFSSAIVYPIGSYYYYNPLTLIATDLNQDHIYDIVTADQGTASVFLGTGGGAFGTVTHYTAGTAATTVVSDDFNGDGQTDIATANFGADITILLGTGNGSLNAPLHFAAGNGPRGLVNGDFNADGSPDLATANNNSNDVSVLLSCAAAGIAAHTNSTCLILYDGKNTISVGEDEGGNLSIFSATGQLAYDQKIDKEKSFDISSLSPGIYIAVLSNSSAGQKKKFVKN